jgi:ubiquinol-cytochrome c reductase iron-sulfur subunit
MADKPVMETSDGATVVNDEPELRRRDFLNIAAVSFAGVGAVVVVLPLVNESFGRRACRSDGRA